MNQVWITKGFEDFSKGTCGNAGQNLYVSRKGVLQRIHQYDLNGDGYFDIVFCNSQNHWEKPPTYVHLDVLGAVSRIELPADGARSGVVADLNGDGYDDLVLGMWHNGIRADLNAFIYYGSPAGFSEEYYISPPFKLPPEASAQKISWEAELPPKSWVRAQLRFANSKEGLEQATWMGPMGEGSWYDNHQQIEATDFAGKWIQYRLALGSRHSVSSPRVKEVAVYYRMPRN